MKICEEYVCIQGEGQYVGVPSYMIRTVGCNLRCSWKNADGGLSICDTPYASFNPETGYEFSKKQTLKKLKKNYPDVRHIIISGGEPTLQFDLKSVVDFFTYHNYIVTIETNGTGVIERDLGNWRHVFLSISPKMNNSYFQKNNIDYKIHLNGNKNVLKSIKASLVNRNRSEYQLKFVVSELKDIIDVKRMIKQCKVPAERVWLMAQGVNTSQLSIVERWLVNVCILNGFNFSPRLHINLYGKKRGV